MLHSDKSVLYDKISHYTQQKSSSVHSFSPASTMPTLYLQTVPKPPSKDFKEYKTQQHVLLSNSRKQITSHQHLSNSTGFPYKHVSSISSVFTVTTFSTLLLLHTLVIFSQSIHPLALFGPQTTSSFSRFHVFAPKHTVNVLLSMLHPHYGTPSLITSDNNHPHKRSSAHSKHIFSDNICLNLIPLFSFLFLPQPTLLPLSPNSLPSSFQNLTVLYIYNIL